MTLFARIGYSWTQGGHTGKMTILWSVAAYPLPATLQLQLLVPLHPIHASGRHLPGCVLIIHRIASFTGQLTSGEHKLSLVIFLSSPHSAQLLKCLLNIWRKQRSLAGLGCLRFTSYASLKHYSSDLLFSKWLYLWQMSSAMCDAKPFFL